VKSPRPVKNSPFESAHENARVCNRQPANLTADELNFSSGKKSFFPFSYGVHSPVVEQAPGICSPTRSSAFWPPPDALVAGQNQPLNQWLCWRETNGTNIHIPVPTNSKPVALSTVRW